MLKSYSRPQPVELNKEFANKLISRINEEAYSRKEKVVEALIKLIRQTSQ